MSEIKLIAQQKVPNTNDIYKKMCRRYSTVDSVLKSLIYTCAEEAERILLQTTRPAEGNYAHKERNAVIVHIHARRYRDHKELAKTAYKCPNCDMKKVGLAHNFCPMCGATINWIFKHRTQ